MKKNNFLNTKTNRAEILTIFSALFCQPEEEFVKSKKIYETLKSSLEVINPDCVGDVQKMQDSLKKYTTQDLLIEYARLFIGPFKIEVPPYSSIYFEEKTLMSNVTIWVLEYYQNAGLNFDKSVKDLPDHVTVETEFLYYLLFNEINAFKEDDLENAQRYRFLLEFFLEKHYKVWVPKFCQKIIENSQNEFYIELATCFKKFVNTWGLTDLTESEIDT